MARWIWALLIGGCVGAMGWSVVEAKDRPVAKSLTRSGPAVHERALRSCAGEDVVGNWNLVTFDSSYRYRNPQAPYLFPYQLFQYSSERGAKSAHSRRPILGSPDRVFDTVPPDMTYRVEQGGRVVLTAKGHAEAVEIWSCSVVTQDREARGGGNDLQRGDLLMTLIGRNGQALFQRHLRKQAA